MRGFRIIILLCCLQVLPASLIGQTAPEKQEIEIIRADALRFSERNNVKSYLLEGNVILQQGTTKLYCDSAYLFSSSNRAAAYGHVHINEADSIHVYGDSALYDGNSKVVRIFENVRLTDRQMVLTTQLLTYRLNERLGIYYNGGTLRSQEAVLTSKTGYYYGDPQTAYFKDSVRLKHPDYRLEADTLEYNTGSDIAYFHGPTTIYNENSTVFCKDGYYVTPTGIAVFNHDARLDNPPQTLLADSIYYDRETGLGKAYGNIVFSDTVQSIIQYSEEALYNEINNVITSTRGSVAGYVMEDDTLFIAGDTIRIEQDSLERNVMFVYPNVRMFKSDFQGVCDSLYYSDADSIIRLFRSPVLWSDSNQFSGDTIFLALKNQQLERMYFKSNGFIINEDDSLIYNQIKGRQITAFFNDNDLYKVTVKGNGESIYFGKDEVDRYLGVNQAQCSDIDMYIKEQQFSRIVFKGKPEAVFTPMQRIDPGTFLLEGFSWQIDRRPKDRAALFQPVEGNQDEGVEENPSLLRSSQKEG